MATTTEFIFTQGGPNSPQKSIVAGYATIDDGETATLPIPCHGRGVVRLGFPTGFDGATVTFTVQAFKPADPATPTASPSFRSLVKADGTAVSITVTDDSIVEVPQLSGCYAFTIVSASAESPAKAIEVQMVGEPAPFDDSAGGGVTGFAAPALTLGTSNVAGSAKTVLATDSTILTFDGTVPTTIASGAAAATGSAGVAARRDHTHGAPTLVSVGDASYTLTNPLVGTQGSAATAARTDMRITVPSPATPTTQAFGDVATSGAGTGFATDTHKHGMPAAPTGDVVLIGSSTATSNSTSTTPVDLVTIGSLSIVVGTVFRVEWNGSKTATNAASVAFGVKVNSTVVIEASAGVTGYSSSATNRAEDGMMVFGANARSAATFLCGFNAYGTWRVSSSGAVSGTQGFNASVNAPMPNATITAIAIRAVNDTSNNNVETRSVRILTGID